jgi:ornithine cyclodeaminase/alanine dehydrogenase-like protein (mu-crystallin family)
MEAFRCVRDIRKLQVFSPTRAHREAFGREMAERYGIEVAVCDRPEDIYRGADIVAALTDSTEPVLDGRHLEKGAHLVNIGGGGVPDAESLRRVDVYLRFGNAPAPLGREDAIEDEYLTWAARPDSGAKRSRRGHGVSLPDKVVYLADIVEGRHPGRGAEDQITYSERGNLQGAQFYALAAIVYEKALAGGLGRTVPTQWLLQDIRD